MPKTRSEHDKMLDQLAALLRERPMTARAIAERMGCCRPAAYQRLNALRERGDAIFTRKPTRPVGMPGPLPVLFGIRS